MSRKCPPRLNQEEFFKIFDLTRKHDPDSTPQEMIELAAWIQSAVEDYHLIVHSLEGDIALRYNSKLKDIESFVTDKGREKKADNITSKQINPISDEDKKQVEKTIKDKLAELTLKTNDEFKQSS